MNLNSLMNFRKTKKVYNISFKKLKINFVFRKIL